MARISTFMLEWRCTTFLCVAFASPLRADAQVVLDRQPGQIGGSASDTDYLLSGNPRNQQAADDFALPEFTSIRSVKFWAYYHEDNPPPIETIRIRFFGSRLYDGLPGELLFEHTTSAANRTATGLVVAVGIAPREYQYQVELQSAFHIMADEKYWISISQVGSTESRLVWEYGPGHPSGYAITNPSVTDWTASNPALPIDLAFQLSTIPEPATLGLMVIGAWFARRRR